MKKFLTIICCVFMFSIIVPLTGCAKEKQYKNYTINFMVEGEVWKTLSSDNINQLINPTKQYCDFAYWEFDKTSIKDNSCNVYAKFTLNSKYTCLEILSGSMLPVLNVGDYIIVDTETTEFNIGDIIAYQIDGVAKPIVHRITAINGDYYMIKGDACSVEETSIITSSQIIGLVCKNIGSTFPNDVVIQTKILGAYA